LEVNTTTGEAKIKNQTGEMIHIDYYEITSGADPDAPTGNSLNPAGWNSFQDAPANPGASSTDFPSGNGSGNGWEEAGGVGVNVLSESFLDGNSPVANGASISLGNAFAVGDPQNLKFRFGQLLDSAPAPAGDYNGDGVANAADYVAWRKQNIGGPGGYDTWRADFGESGGPGGTSTLITSFVRYVTSGSSPAVPEPSAVFLVGMGLAMSGVVGRRTRLA
jgi:hypothetical protein